MAKAKKKLAPKKTVKKSKKKSSAKKKEIPLEDLIPNVKKKTINFKVLPEQAHEIKSVAEKYTRGNVTALVQLALDAYHPSKKDLETLQIRASTR